MWFSISILLIQIVCIAGSVEQIRIEENRNVTLMCEFRWENSSDSDSQSDQVILWYKDENEVIGVNTVSNDPSKYSIIQINQRTYQMIIFRVQLESSGIYKCQNFTAKEENRFQLTVLAPPSDLELRSTPHLLVADRGTTVFNCSAARVYPQPTFEWYQNGRLIQRSLGDRSNLNSYSSFAILTLSLSYLDHNQTLRCRVSNAVQERSVFIDTKLDVLFPPVITLAVNEQMMNHSWALAENTSIIVHCSLLANPPVLSAIEWFKNDQLVTDSYVTEENQSQLTIYWTRETKSDKLACRARNSFGLSERSVHIQYLYQPKLSMPEQLTLNQGERMILLCSIDANPSCHRINWLKDGVELSSQPCPLSNQTSMIVELQIENVSRHQMGNYTCQVTNWLPDSFGFKKETTSMISTDVRIRYAPLIMNKHRKIAIDAHGHQPFVIPCQIDAYPKGEILWFGPSNQRLDHFAEEKLVNRTIVVSTLTLSSSSRSNLIFGIYQCFARNSFGASRFSFEIQGASVPEPIEQWTINNLTDSSFNLEWQAGFDGGAEQTFNIILFMNQTELRRQSKRNSVWFRDLEANTEYRIVIRTSNIFGLSSNRTIITVQTLPTSQMASEIPKVKFISNLHTSRHQIHFQFDSNHSSNRLDSFCLQYFDSHDYDQSSSCIPLESLRISHNEYQLTMDNVDRRFQICFLNQSEICSKSITLSKPTVFLSLSNDWFWIFVGGILGLTLVLIFLAAWIMVEHRRRKRRTTKKYKPHGNTLSSISVRVRDSNSNPLALTRSELSTSYYRQHKPFAYTISEKKNSFGLDSGVPSTTSTTSDTSTSNIVSSSDIDERIKSEGKLSVTDSSIIDTRDPRWHLPIVQHRTSSPSDNEEEESGFSTPTQSHQGKKLVFEVIV